MELRDNGVTRIECKAEKMLLDKDNIDRFILLKNRRDLRTSVINSLVRLLESGKHFDSPFVTIRKKNTFGREYDELLDANHRQAAIKKFFTKYPNRKIEVWVMYYENLNEEQTKEKYKTWNIGTKQSTNDFVKQYWNDMPIVKKLERDFPCKVSHAWGVKTIEFKTLIASYLVRDSEYYVGGFGGSAVSFVDQAKTLTTADHTILKQFMNDYVQVFGDPEKDKDAYRQANYYTLFRLWWDNRSRPKQDLIGMFQKVKGSKTMEEYAKTGGTREACMLCHQALTNKINGKSKKNIFV